MIMMNNLSFDKEEMTKWEWGNFFKMLIPSSEGEGLLLMLIAFSIIVMIIGMIHKDEGYPFVITSIVLIIFLVSGYIAVGTEEYNKTLVEEGKKNLQEVAFESISAKYDLDQNRINNIEPKIDEEDNKVTLNRLAFDYDDLKSSTTYELNFAFDDNGAAQIMKTDSVTDKVIKQFEK